MERIVATQMVDGARVDLVEVLDEDDASYLVVVDGVAANAFEPFSHRPDREEVLAMVRRRRAAPGQHGRPPAR